MNVAQRRAVLLGLLALAVSLHALFCDWGALYESANILQLGGWPGYSTGVVPPRPAPWDGFGIKAGGGVSVTTALLFGVIVPLAIAGGAFVLHLGWRRWWVVLLLWTVGVGGCSALLLTLYHALRAVEIERAYPSAPQ
jgi:hypothetical protein